MTHYIRRTAEGDPVSHIEADRLPYDKAGKPMFVTSPKGRKDWYQPAVLVEEEVGQGQRRTGPFYEDLEEKTATIRFGVEDMPAPVDQIDARYQTDPAYKALVDEIADIKSENATAVLSRMKGRK